MILGIWSALVSIVDRVSGNDLTINDSGQLHVFFVGKNIEGGGKISVGVTAVEMSFSGTTKIIIITADIFNSRTIYIGKSDVTTLGANSIAYLEAGDTIALPYDDYDNAIYAVGSEASQNVWKGAIL